MSDQLRDAFRDLAADAPDIDATAAGSAQTWRRARQSRRRGVVAVSLAVIAVLIGGVFLAVGLSGVTRPSPAGPVPYDESKLAIPNRIWLPSPFVPGTAASGPIGPLALIGLAPRRTGDFLDDQEALFGVSAATGRYEFIDLPDANGGLSAGVALSPDGTKLAYWMSGGHDSPVMQSRFNGYEIYNTVSGVIRGHVVPDRYGLAPNWLSWTPDSGQVVASFGRYEINSKAGAGASDAAPVQMWDPITGSVREFPRFTTQARPSAGPNGVDGFDSRGHLMTLDPATGQLITTWLGHAGSVNAAISPDLHRVAYNASQKMEYTSTGSYSAGPPFLATATSGRHPAWLTHVLRTQSPSTEVIGWTDDSHVLLGLWRSSRSEVLASLEIVTFDVDTGEQNVAIRLMGDSPPWPSFATDLLRRPLVMGKAPADPRDAHLIPWAVGGIGGICIVALLMIARIRAARRRSSWEAQGTWP